MHTLIMQGKVCYWGTSEWSALDIQEAYEISRKLNLTLPSMEQMNIICSEEINGR